MTPYYADDWLTVFHGDCREVMTGMEPESVHCVVTSPPYWGLRDYGTATWVGGDAACDHLMTVGGAGKSTLGAASGGHAISDERQRASQEAQRTPYRHTCGKCGAIRQDSQLGLEPTPEEYVANLVAVFREVKRVLRKDGTVWLNLGDSYASQPAGNKVPSYGPQFVGRDMTGVGQSGVMDKIAASGLKPKDLVGIPWRVAFALQADGWYLRSDVIWSKLNPMPESVTDRPTKSHEYLFLLSKSPRYFWDADAVREPHNGYFRARSDEYEAYAPPGQEAHGGLHRAHENGRNIRSVWTMATQPYPGAHFATFPETLPERCIKAGTSEKGVCPECGAPWERVTTSVGVEAKRERNVGGRTDGFTRMPGGEAEWSRRDQPMSIGWQTTCRFTCSIFDTPSEPVPATVLDCFAGSGTTGMVAQSLSRRAVLIDLSLDYLDQLMARNADIPLGLGA